MNGITWIVLIFIIVALSRKNKGNTKPSSKDDRYTAAPMTSNRKYDNTPMQQRQSALKESNKGQPAVQKQQPAKQKAEQKQAKPNGREESTTEYLRKKAAQDEKEHRKEKLEQQKREQSYAKLHYAERWIEGDPIPPSKKMVKCGYCGAENLISFGSHGKYNCYFCREEL